MVWQETVILPTSVTIGSIPIISTKKELGGLVYLANTPGLQPGANGSNPLSSTKILLKGESRWTVVRLVGR